MESSDFNRFPRIRCVITVKQQTPNNKCSSGASLTPVGGGVVGGGDMHGQDRHDPPGRAPTHDLTAITYDCMSKLLIQERKF